MTKQRFDNNEKSKFAEIHRHLHQSYTMFDIDYQQVNNTIYETENSLYNEYSTDFFDGDVDFKAMFDVKYKMTDSLKATLNDIKKGTALYAQIIMSRKLEQRFFVVVENKGNFPLTFLEVDTKTFKYKSCNILKETNSVKDIQNFWKNKLKL